MRSGSATLSLPKYRRHRSGQARVTLPGTPRRRTVYLGRFGSEESKQAYQRVIQEWLLERTVPPPAVMCAAVERSVADLIEAYLLHAQDYYRHSASERKRIKLAMRPLRELYGSMPAAKFGPLALKAVRQRMWYSAGRGLQQDPQFPAAPRQEPAGRRSRRVVPR
jgi:hypothetical protein